MPSDAEHAAIDLVAQRLSRQFSTMDTALVTRVVWDTYRHFDTHPTRDVVPILVQDAARDRRSGWGGDAVIGIDDSVTNSRRCSGP